MQIRPWSRTGLGAPRTSTRQASQEADDKDSAHIYRAFSTTFPAKGGCPSRLYFQHVPRHEWSLEVAKLIYRFGYCQGGPTKGLCKQPEFDPGDASLDFPACGFI